MSNTERTRRHRDRLREIRAERERIQRVYFNNRPPLSQKERRRLVREMAWLINPD